MLTGENNLWFEWS